MAGEISAGIGLYNLFRGLGASGRERKREAGQVGVLQEQYAELLERLEGSSEYFDLLREFEEEGFDLESRELSRGFAEESFSLGKRESEVIRRSGMVSGGTADEFDIAREFGERELRGAREGLRLDREGQLIGIGRAENLDEQRIQDMLYQVETAIKGRGGFATQEETLADFQKVVEGMRSNTGMGGMGLFGYDSEEGWYLGNQPGPG